MSSRPPRAVEDPVDWTLRGRRLQARVVGDGLIRLSRVLGTVSSRAWKWATRQYWEREAIRQLDRLDDHLLRDIGIRRSEIPLVVRGQVPAGTEAAFSAERRPGASANAKAADHGRLAA